jgi:hypothetical protein
MTYGLPVHGEQNWDTKLSASIVAVKATADAAETPVGSQAKADAAQVAATAAAATDATTKANAVQTNLTTHTGNTSNPHVVTKAQVGLGSVPNVDATARANHTGTQAAGTITGLATVATSGLKADVGLGNVDNTSDANKPVSTAQQTALDLKRDRDPAVNAQTGTTYTLVLADGAKWITMSNASASTLTVPPNSSVAFPVGTQIEGAQLGAGQVTLTQGAGVTINATPGLKIAAQYGTFGLKKIATDTWLAYGRLSA